MDTGVGIVEPKRLKLELPEGELRLAYGGVLKEVEVAYEECGAPMKDDNVVYICHALTGDAHVAGIRPGQDKPSGWWEGMVGPGRAIDTNRYHVVCANVLGGCSGTTGPMSVNPDTGRPYGSSFPRYSFDDAVAVFRMLLAQIGVKRLAALIGGSYGGMQAINWATRFPDDMDRLILVATSPSLNTQALVSRLLSGSAGRFVLDADALTILAGWYGTNDGYEPSAGQELVLTPHEGEAARLLGCDRSQVSADRSAAARELADRYGATIVLKGPRTIVMSSDGTRAYENGTGNPFMAMGGMGDLLAGVIGARWAYLKGDPFLAAAASVWLHGAGSDSVIERELDPSIANTAAAIGSLRVRLDR